MLPSGNMINKRDLQMNEFNYYCSCKRNNNQVITQYINYIIIAIKCQLIALIKSV